MTDCDVAIIGAGVIGGSIVYELASRGASVTVLDSRAAGQGATQAAAGMRAPYIEGFGRPILAMAARSLGMYDDFVRRISEDSGLTVDYVRGGSLQVITADEPADHLLALQTAAVAAGVRCALLDAAQIHDLEPLITPDIAGGMLIPDHGVVVPGSLSRALTAAAMARGARFESDRQVERVDVRDGGFSLEWRAGRLDARRVIVAGGSWSGRLAIDGVPPLPVRPVRGQLLHLTSTGPSPRRVIWGAGCYIAPSSGGAMSVGATMEEAGFDERATVAGVRDLLDAATELMPSLWQSTFEGARVGLRPATPDEMPIMGRSHTHPGLFYATGHFRNGILLAPLTGRVMADLVLDNREDPVLAAASPQRFGEYDMAILSPEEVERQLKTMRDWTLEGRAIRKQYTFPNFPAAVAFVTRLVPEAEAADHHPDITINYRKVTLLYSTHDEGGLTQKDFDGAAMADRNASRS